MKIVAVGPGHPDAAHSLARYFAELDERFDEGFDASSSAAPTLDGFEPPTGTFVVAYVDDRPVGCGGFKRLDAGRAYLKRMWVDPAARGIGMGRALLADLEQRARAAGYSAMVLDTHRSLTEAQALYRRHGYAERSALTDEPYGDLWFEKDLCAAF